MKRILCAIIVGMSCNMWSLPYAKYGQYAHNFYHNVTNELKQASSADKAALGVIGLFGLYKAADRMADYNPFNIRNAISLVAGCAGLSLAESYDSSMSNLVAASLFSVTKVLLDSMCCDKYSYRYEIRDGGVDINYVKCGLCNNEQHSISVPNSENLRNCNDIPRAIRDKINEAKERIRSAQHESCTGKVSTYTGISDWFGGVCNWFSSS